MDVHTDVDLELDLGLENKKSSASMLTQSFNLVFTKGSEGGGPHFASSTFIN